MKNTILTFSLLLSSIGYCAQRGANEISVEPLFTKSAKIYDGVIVDAYAEFYHGRQFQEIKDVDATELKLDIVFPILNNAQLRLSLPFYTDGDGLRIDNGQKTELEGNGGTFDFASIAYEQQFKNVEHDNIDMMGYAGIGVRTANLETAHSDFMNHQGKNISAGIKLSTNINPSMLFLTDLGYQYYWVSDDLNPSRGSDQFGNAIASIAVIKHDNYLKPAIELTYRGDLSDYNNLAISPELIYSFDNVDLKLGIPIGITSDADDYGFTVGLTYR